MEKIIFTFLLLILAVIGTYKFTKAGIIDDFLKVLKRDIFGSKKQ